MTPEHRAFVSEQVSKAWRSLAEERGRALVEAESKIDEIGRLLEANGCDCGCDHDNESHDDDCERCFACRVSGVLGPKP